MGKEYTESVGPNQSAIVPTGGQIPEGADVSVMIENTMQYEHVFILFDFFFLDHYVVIMSYEKAKTYIFLLLPFFCVQLANILLI